MLYLIYSKVKVTAFHIHPLKMLLQDLPRKGPFSCIPARSCEILWDFARILQESYSMIPARFLQNPTRSNRNARKKDLSLEDLARAFYWAVTCTVI